MPDPASPPAEDTTDIDRLRRFQRIVTRETGALEHSFLGRGRPLNAARVLNTIGRGVTELGALRADLGLDSGLMSRLLRGLEAEGLVATGPAAEDKRRRVAALTPAGRAEVAAYEALANARARALLDAHPDQSALLAAMDLVAAAFGRDAVTLEETDPRAPAARACLARYYGELAARLDTGFDVSRSRDPEAGDMMAPRGVFLVAWSDGIAVGCGGLKGHPDAATGPWGEVKRVWVAPSARGMRLAARMMAALETRARALGYPLLRLDTNSALPEAVALYRRTGWHEIARFNDDPYPDVFFEKRL